MTTATASQTPTLAAKLVSIMSELGPIKKTGFNSFHKYYYLKEDDIINAVRPLLTKHGVAIIPNVLEEHVSERPTAKGGSEVLSRLKVEYTFVDIETGQQIPVVSVGHGSDSGDKAAYKALTGALKYALRQMLMISEGGEDPEADEAGDARRAQAYDEHQPNVVQITPSAVPGAGRGGRNKYPNQIQIDELRNQAKAANMTVRDLAGLIWEVNNVDIDVTDPATAGIALQGYLVAASAAEISVLIREIMNRAAKPTIEEPTLFEEMPDGPEPFSAE